MKYPLISWEIGGGEGKGGVTPPDPTPFYSRQIFKDDVNVFPPPWILASRFHGVKFDQIRIV
jgi:hypothetical protein